MGSQGDEDLGIFQITLKYTIKISTVKAAQLFYCYVLKKKILLPSSGMTGA